MLSIEEDADIANYKDSRVKTASGDNLTLEANDFSKSNTGVVFRARPERQNVVLIMRRIKPTFCRFDLP